MKWSFLLALVVVILGMTHQAVFLQAALTTVVLVWCGGFIFQKAWTALKARRGNMFTLGALGVGTTYIYSLIAWSQGWDVYFEGAAAITVLFSFGYWLETRLSRQAKNALSALINLVPRTATVLEGQTERSVDVSEIQPGMVLRVRPAERIPVDGVVLTGRSVLDLSAFTGESLPVEKAPGDNVLGGSLNGSGTFTMQVQKMGRDMLLGQMINTMEKTLGDRTPLQHLADRVSRVFVPTVVAAALVTALVWFFFGPDPKIQHGVLAAVAVIMISCPCALGFATPMSVAVATGRGAKQGLLIQKADAFERFANVDTIVFDKTGTLTQGQPRIQRVVCFGVDETSLLAKAASLESASEHPLAQAFLTMAQERSLTLDPPEHFEAVVGQGIWGSWGNARFFLGSERFLKENKVLFTDEVTQRISSLQREFSGHTLLYFAQETTLWGAFALGDNIKPEAARVVQSLQKQGLKILMLTGDTPQTAQIVGENLKLDGVFGGLLPMEKHTEIQKLQQAGHRVAMVGDGVNDALALAQADVGLAMGSGTDAAKTSAGITIISEDLSKVLDAFVLSRQTVRNMKQNLFLAFVYNVLAIPVAAGILYPFLGILLNPMLASLAMTLSSVSVIGNALRLRKV